MTLPDVEAVGSILRDVARAVIAPRFRALADHEIEEKSPGEVVTIADREAEARITAGLRGLLPGVPVVGEEAAEADPALVDAVASAPAAWLVDPLDGTANFARGDAHWAVMVALVRAGETVGAWIWRNSERALYTAERGSGAWRDGARLVVAPAPADPATWRGAVLTRFLTAAERDRMTPRFGRFAAVTGGYLCAGDEYPALVAGEQQFALFQRLLPWDHAPGVLLLAEAGGVARHPEGDAFRPGSGRRGLLLGASEDVWERARMILYGG